MNAIGEPKKVVLLSLTCSVIAIVSRARLSLQMLDQRAPKPCAACRAAVFGFLTVCITLRYGSYSVLTLFSIYSSSSPLLILPFHSTLSESSMLLPREIQDPRQLENLIAFACSLPNPPDGHLLHLSTRPQTPLVLLPQTHRNRHILILPISWKQGDGLDRSIARGRRRGRRRWRCKTFLVGGWRERMF